MYQADRFLELARENLGEQVSDEIVEEIREVRRLDKLAHRKLRDSELDDVKSIQLMQLEQVMAHLNEQTRACQHELSELSHLRIQLENERSMLKDYWKNTINDSNPDDAQLLEFHSIAAKNREEIEQRITATQLKLHQLTQQKSQLMQQKAQLTQALNVLFHQSAEENERSGWK